MRTGRTLTVLRCLVLTPPPPKKIGDPQNWRTPPPKNWRPPGTRPPPPLWTEWQTGVKYYLGQNFVSAGNKGNVNRRLRSNTVWLSLQSNDQRTHAPSTSGHFFFIFMRFRGRRKSVSQFTSTHSGLGTSLSEKSWIRHWICSLKSNFSYLNLTNETWSALLGVTYCFIFKQNFFAVLLPTYCVTQQLSTKEGSFALKSKWQRAHRLIN